MAAFQSNGNVKYEIPRTTLLLDIADTNFYCGIIDKLSSILCIEAKRKLYELTTPVTLHIYEAHLSRRVRVYNCVYTQQLRKNLNASDNHH